MSSVITYLSGGTPISTELFVPAGTPLGTAVVIAHGSDGVTDDLNGPWATMMRDYGSELAEAGVIALLPHYFEKTGTAPGMSAMQAMMLHMPRWQEALAAAIGHAETLPGITRGRVALLGFSLGGHLSLRLRGSAKVVVEFFAPYLSGIGTRATAAPHLQIHHGGGDDLVKFSNAERIASVLKAEGVAPVLYEYAKAGHGFSGTDENNTSARKLSKKRTLEFLAAHL